MILGALQPQCWCFEFLVIRSIFTMCLRHLLFFGVLMATSTSSAQILITQWDFDAANTSPSSGTGSISLIGGTTATFAGGFDDENVGYRTASYPMQGQGNSTAGIEMQLSTVGFTGITLSYNVRHGMEAANSQSVLWSTGNGIFQTAQVFTITPEVTGSANTWFTRTVNLPSATEHQGQLYIQIVSSFSPGLNTYGATQLGNSYNASGPVRFDNISFSGTTSHAHVLLGASPVGFSAVPEPATSAAAAAAALVGFAALRKRCASTASKDPETRVRNDLHPRNKHISGSQPDDKIPAR